MDYTLGCNPQPFVAIVYALGYVHDANVCQFSIRDIAVLSKNSKYTAFKASDKTTWWLAPIVEIKHGSVYLHKRG